MKVDSSPVVSNNGWELGLELFLYLQGCYNTFGLVHIMGCSCLGLF